MASAMAATMAAATTAPAATAVAAAATGLRGRQGGKVRTWQRGRQRGKRGDAVRAAAAADLQGRCEGVEGAGARVDVQAGVRRVGFAATGFDTGPGPRHAAPAEQPIWALLAAMNGTCSRSAHNLCVGAPGWRTGPAALTRAGSPVPPAAALRRHFRSNIPQCCCYLSWRQVNPLPLVTWRPHLEFWRSASGAANRLNWECIYLCEDIPTINRVCARVPGSDCAPTAADAHSSRHSNGKPPSETTRGVLASALLTMPAQKGHIPFVRAAGPRRWCAARSP